MALDDAAASGERRNQLCLPRGRSTSPACSSQREPTANSEIQTKPCRLSWRGHQTFPDLLREYICRPSRMESRRRKRIHEEDTKDGPGSEAIRIPETLKSGGTTLPNLCLQR